MAKRIQLRIFSDGLIQADVQGIKGKKCTEYIRILEEILDAETVDSSRTPEYFERAAESVSALDAHEPAVQQRDREV